MEAMKVAVCGGCLTKHYEIVNKKILELIETSQCFLFYILCGYVEGRKSSQETIGEKWAKENGLPILYISEKSSDRLLDRLLFKADYIIFILDGNPATNNAFMRYKMLGKHGSVIRVAD